MKAISIILLMTCFIEMREVYSQNVLDGNFERVTKKNFPCETSRIGRLITMPLQKDSVIHYELAFKGNWNSKLQNADSVSFDDNMEGIHVVRRHNLKDTLLNLLFMYDSTTQSCLYELSAVYEKEKRLEIFNIDDNGKIISWAKRQITNSGEKYLSDLKKNPFTNIKIKEQQLKVKAFMIHFE
jgi:hypothetical protein